MNLRRTLAVVCAAVSAIASPASGQTDQDAWDEKFNPQALKRRINRRTQEWVASWQGRMVQIADVKAYWRLSLTLPTPGTLDSSYHRVRAHNDSVHVALEGTAWDAEAQDIADTMNVEQLRRRNLNAEADALEQARLARIRAREQQQAIARMVARQDAINQQLTQEVTSLRNEVYLAQREAERARARAAAAEQQARGY